MAIYANKTVELARKYIGYMEKNSDRFLYEFTTDAGSGNHTMFAHELDKAGFWNNDKCGYEWCTSFVAWLFFHQIGKADAKRVLCLTGEYGASCTRWVEYWRAAGRFFATPQVGDQYFQADSKGEPCHTGIVSEVGATKFKTIEGNCGNKVQEREYYLDNKLNKTKTYGFGRPIYDAEMKLQEEKTMAEAIYKDIKDVPAYWRASVQKLLDAGIINGGTDAAVNATDVNLTKTEAKMAHIMVSYTDFVAAELKREFMAELNGIDEAIVEKLCEKILDGFKKGGAEK